MCGCGKDRYCPGGCACGCDHKTKKGRTRQAKHFALQHNDLRGRIDSGQLGSKPHQKAPSPILKTPEELAAEPAWAEEFDPTPDESGAIGDYSRLDRA